MRVMRSWRLPTRIHHPSKGRRSCVVADKRKPKPGVRFRHGLLLGGLQGVRPETQNLIGKGSARGGRIAKGGVSTASREADLKFCIEHGAVAFSSLTKEVLPTYRMSDRLPTGNWRLGYASLIRLLNSNKSMPCET